MSGAVDPVRADNSTLFAECCAWGFALAAISSSNARTAPANATRVRWLLSRRLERLVKEQRLDKVVDRVVEELAHGLGKWRASSLCHEIIEGWKKSEAEVFDV